MPDPRSRRLALLALLLLTPAPSLGVLASMVFWPGPIGQTIFVVSKLWLALFPAAWLLWVDRNTISISRSKHGGFAVATALGIVIAIIILAAYFAFARNWIDAEQVSRMAQRTGIGTPVMYLAGAFLWCVVNSLVEEYVWRWFVFRKCEIFLPACGGWLAIVLSAALFTAHHVAALAMQFDTRVTVIASLGVFIGGVVWSWLYRRYRSIWPGYVSHLIVDAAIFLIGWWLIFGR